MKATVVILLLVCAVLARAYWVARRKIDRRDAQSVSQAAELTLTREAHDRQTADAVRLRAEVTRMAIRNSELRDQLDVATGNVDEPTLTEQFLTWLAEEPLTYPEDPR